MNHSLLLLHGFATSPDIWDTQKTKLSKRYNIITDPEEARDIKGDLTIIGWSMGAQKAVNLYFDLHDKVRSLVLVSATPRFLQEEEFPHGLPLSLLENLRRKLKSNLNEGLQFFYSLLFPGAENHPLIKKMPPFSQEEILLALESLQVEDVRGLLHKIEVPTLLVHGEKDQICRPQAAQYMADIIPNVSLKLLPEVGHAPQLEKPEEFCEIIQQFI